MPGQPTIISAAQTDSVDHVNRISPENTVPFLGFLSSRKTPPKMTGKTDVLNWEIREFHKHASLLANGLCCGLLLVDFLGSVRCVVGS